MQSVYSAAPANCAIKELNLSTYLSTDAGRTDVYMVFSNELARTDKQIALSLTWTRVDNSIVNDDNRYTKHASKKKESVFK